MIQRGMSKASLLKKKTVFFWNNSYKTNLMVKIFMSEIINSRSYKAR